MEPERFPYEWDLAKAASNLRKHGVSFVEASSVFDDGLALVMPDQAHSVGEERLAVIGMSRLGRILVASHTERGDLIRIISAREAMREERKNYESR